METDISTLLYAGTAIMVTLSLAVIFTVVILHQKLKNKNGNNKIILK